MPFDGYVTFPGPITAEKAAYIQHAIREARSRRELMTLILDEGGTYHRMERPKIPAIVRRARALHR